MNRTGNERESPVAVRLPRALTNLFQGATPIVHLSASTISEVFHQLDARWPGMRDRLCDSSPAIRRHINVFVERKRATLETELSPGTEVTILTAISGG